MLTLAVMTVLRQLARVQTRRGTPPQVRLRPRERGAVHEFPIGARATLDPLARARAARIIAERQLMIAIRRAELRYEKTAQLGTDFDRRLERTKSALREAGYLKS